ncbi:MAG TPA: metal-dependent hydrolase [Stackebrandtia sp.]|jgi:predicted metal-dependent hydrolase|uniref:metal-dependent hydrolase n=1 Tax=Stackebrandtia sp. TaxID=2023065 RepID=UPI002D59351E|nr:metal-dependent hydrolase [Stackebrandtia sp.]HZE40661.1 metal-dependent hydrolase [Stackebrandtia sp.]
MATSDRPEPGDDSLVLHPRDVQFDWETLPLHWIPGEPFATHTINVLHLLLPEGERWFVRTFTQALPLIRDDRLREDVRGFIGQETMHAEAHNEVVEHLNACGIDPGPYVRQVEWIFRDLLGDRAGLSERARRRYLVERLAVIAAIEHFTAFLGHWVLNARELDAAGADPDMLDLLRWHGSEEVEHRHVAFDVARHVHRSYPLRVRSALSVAYMLIMLWWRGLRFFIEADPVLSQRKRARLRSFMRAAGRGLLPRIRHMVRWMLRYLRPGYHPSWDCSTPQAVAYLASSPAARAAR